MARLINTRISRSLSVQLEIRGGKRMVAWDRVTRRDVLRAIHEYDRLGPEQFFSEHGFAPTTTHNLVWDERGYPPKAILGTAYEFATGDGLAPLISRAGTPAP